MSHVFPSADPEVPIPEEFAKLFETFFDMVGDTADSGVKLLRQLKEHATTGDVAGMRQSAHALHSVASTVGAERLAAAVHAWQKQPCSDCIVQLCTIFDETCAKFNQRRQLA